MVKRVFQGVGNHTDADILFVSRWTGIPGDNFTTETPAEREEWASSMFAATFGGLFGMPTLLLDENQYVGCMSAKWGKECTVDDRPECRFLKNGICRPPRWKFKFDIEIERIEE